MQKAKILLGEASEMLAIDMARLLKDKAVHLDLARNAVALLNRYETGRYDLILLNTSLEDSVAVTYAIRKKEATGRAKLTPIIGIFSVLVKDEDFIAKERQKYLDAGMDEVISHPLSEEDIDKILEKYLR